MLHLKDKFGKALALVVVNALRVRLVQAINELYYIDNDLGFNHWFGAILYHSFSPANIGYQRK